MNEMNIDVTYRLDIIELISDEIGTNDSWPHTIEHNVKYEEY